MLFRSSSKSVPAVVAKHWLLGSSGAQDLAKQIITAAEAAVPSPLTTVYPPDIELLDKIKAGFNLSQFDGLSGSPGKSQKEGQEDQGTLKQLGGTP